MINEQEYRGKWPLWQKVLFRFLCIYFTLLILSWPFFEEIGVLRLLRTLQHYVLDTAVNAFNGWFVHLPSPLTDLRNGNDSPFRLVQTLLFLVLAVLGTAVWSIAGRRHASYNRANYYFTTLLRCFLIFMCFLYGSVKIFLLQMPFPLISDMATPLGEFSPMDLSWHYVGYSPIYEFFLGAAEVITGLLLLYRRTRMPGLFIGLSIYVNVLMINLCYDVPVKIFSIHLVLICICLLLTYLRRIINFFILDKPVKPATAYATVPATGYRRTYKYALQTVFILGCIFIFFSRAKSFNRIKMHLNPIPHGVYAVDVFVKNGDTLPVLANDSLIWKDIIFERDYDYATVNSVDTIFSPDNSRGGFFYKADTLARTLKCFKLSTGKRQYIFKLSYVLGKNGKVTLATKIKSDSIVLNISLRKKDFRLAKRPFHWLGSPVN